jgi:hypothetical protein
VPKAGKDTTLKAERAKTLQQIAVYANLLI